MASTSGGLSKSCTSLKGRLLMRSKLVPLLAQFDTIHIQIVEFTVRLYLQPYMGVLKPMLVAE